jgi:hypothetical protein
MSNLKTRSDDLAVRIVSYCNEKTLSLGGLVARLEAGETLTVELCDAIGTYCNDNVLTLGVGGASLHAEVWALWEDYRAEAETLAVIANRRDQKPTIPELAEWLRSRAESGDDIDSDLFLATAEALEIMRMTDEEKRNFGVEE